jgi:hypothetical protein
LPKREQATLGLSSDRVEYIKGLIAKLDPPRLPDPIANPPAASLSPAVPADAPALTVTRSSERSPEPGNLLRRTGFAAIAAGGLALAVGSVAGLVARNAQDQIENTREGAPYDVTTDERGRTAATTATVAFVMAPVLIGLGAAALWYGPRLGGEAAAGGEANIVARARTGRGGPSQFKITPIVAGSGTFGATLTGSY